MENTKKNEYIPEEVKIYKKFDRKQSLENRHMINTAKKQIVDTKKQIEETDKLLQDLKDKSVS